MSITNVSDFIVVGGGASGGVLACRLAQFGFSVTLLESGRPAPDSSASFSQSLWSGELVCRRPSVSQPGLGGRKVELLLGQVLGGSSTMNSMMYVRGNRSDYDSWGSPQWSYRTVLEYFKRSESHGSRKNDFHGNAGPVEVRRLPQMSQLSQRFVAAGAAFGFQNENWDFNGDVQQNGIGFYDLNVYADGRRWGVANAFLSKPPGRLRIETDRLVQRLLFKGSRVEGVAALSQGSRQDCFASKEGILSAGSLDTPAIFMRSGVGPEEVIKHAGIELHLKCESLGDDLHDHISSGVVFETVDVEPGRPSLPEAGAFFKPGALGQNVLPEFNGWS